MRRLPRIVRYRADQMYGVPVSTVKTASSAASRSTVAVRYSGRIGWCSGPFST